jgi:hypothetical protein
VGTVTVAEGPGLWQGRTTIADEVRSRVESLTLALGVFREEGREEIRLLGSACNIGVTTGGQQQTRKQ